MSMTDAVKQLQESWEILFDLPAPVARTWAKWILAYGEDAVGQGLARISSKFDSSRNLTTDDLVRFLDVNLGSAQARARRTTTVTDDNKGNR